MLLFACLLVCFTLVQSAYDRSELTQDGLGNDLLFPQMTASLSNGHIVVYHYNVNGVQGKSGLSIIDRSGVHIRTIDTITPLPGTSTAAPGQFVNDPFLAYYPYAADYMVAHYDAALQREVLDVILPIETPIQGGVAMQMVGMVLDTEGHYVRALDVQNLQRPTVPYASASLTIQHIASTRTIVIGGPSQPLVQALNLTSYWQPSGGRVTLAADIQTVTSGASTKLVVLLDDSQQAYPYVSQTLLILDPLTGQLIETINPMIQYDTNQMVVYGKSQVTVANDQSLILVQPSAYGSRSVYLFTPSGPAVPPSIQAGQVDNVWFTNLGYLQSQAVLSDGCVVTTTVSATQVYARTLSVLITRPATKTVVSSFSTITGLTAAAQATGASANLQDYLIVALFADQQDRIYMSNFYQDGFYTGIVPGVLIVTRTGAFVDWYTGFDLPQTVGISRDGYLLVPDRWQSLLHVFDMSTHTLLQSAYCGGCLGIDHDPAHAGYVITTSNQYMNSAAVEFMNADFTYNVQRGTVQFTFYSGYSDQAALSNPVTDSQGRIYVLVASQAGQSRSTAVLNVYDPNTRQVITSNDWANPQPRGIPGVSQLAYGLTLSINRADQSIVVSTIDFGQIFKTKPF